MTHRHRVSLFAFSVGSTCLLLAGCASSRPQSFATSFLPTTTPLPLPANIPIEQPPPVMQSLYTSEIPNLTPAIPPEIERRMLKAEERFEAGKQAYLAGDVVLARTEFDRALDVLLSAPQDLADRERLENRLEELSDAIYKYDLDKMGANEAKQKVAYDKSPLESMLEMTFPIDPKLKPKVKEEIHGTVSQLPLEQNDTVLSYINYFSTERGRHVLVNGLRRAGRYKPMIERILAEEGVPQELMCLAQAESGFYPRAVSNKAATGMWQFVAWRGNQYGLKQTPNCDERLDPEKSTRAAARHLRDLYAIFGDWYLAMAAYNCGPNCVDHAVQRTGYADFWELSSRNALPKQTMNYVPLILALTIMTKNPNDYGLDHIDAERPIEYDTLTLKASTNIDLIADASDRPVSELRELNPALLKSVAPAGYEVHVPKDSVKTVLAALEEVPESHRATYRLHRVQQGETMAAVAKRFSVSADALAAANHRTVEGPESGDLLVIPTTADPDRGVARKTVAARRPAARRGGPTVASAHVSPKVLDHKAGPKTVKTASLHHTNTAQ